MNWLRVWVRTFLAWGRPRKQSPAIAALELCEQAKRHDEEWAEAGGSWR